MDIRKEYERWLENAIADADIVEELKTMDEVKIEDAFYRNLAFGTGGLRGVIGAGTNRMNVYTVATVSVQRAGKSVRLRPILMVRLILLDYEDHLIYYTRKK